MMEKGWNHPRLTRCIDTDSMHHRKQTMASMVRAAVALPEASAPSTNSPKS